MTNIKFIYKEEGLKAYEKIICELDMNKLRDDPAFVKRISSGKIWTYGESAVGTAMFDFENERVKPSSDLSILYTSKNDLKIALREWRGLMKEKKLTRSCSIRQICGGSLNDARIFLEAGYSAEAIYPKGFYMIGGKEYGAVCFGLNAGKREIIENSGLIKNAALDGLKHCKNLNSNLDINIKCRRAAAEDEKRISEIMGASFRNYHNISEEVENSFGKGPLRSYVAEIGSEISSVCIILEIGMGMRAEYEIATEPKFRGMGAGKALTRYIGKAERTSSCIQCTPGPVVKVAAASGFRLANGILGNDIDIESAEIGNMEIDARNPLTANSNNIPVFANHCSIDANNIDFSNGTYTTLIEMIKLGEG